MPSERTALVTGGGRGIGARIARELAADRWRVVVSARSREQVEAVAQELDGVAVEGDVTRADDVERMVAEAGPVDLLVANAGIAVWERRAWEVPVEEWWRVIEVNVLGVHLCCRAVIPGMLERGGGRIVIVGSGASYLPGNTNTAYGASKAAVGRYGETLARQLEGQIPVFVISPGLVRTDMTAAVRRRRAVDAAGARAAPRPRARLGPLRRALGPVPPRRARSRGGAGAEGGADPGRRPERAAITARNGLSDRLSLVRFQPVRGEGAVG